MPASRKKLQEAQALCAKYNVAAIFAEHQFNRVLHWNEEMQWYELRARLPGRSDIDKHVAPLHVFIAWTPQQQHARLTFLATLVH